MALAPRGFRRGTVAPLLTALILTACGGTTVIDADDGGGGGTGTGTSTGTTTGTGTGTGTGTATGTGSGTGTGAGRLIATVLDASFFVNCQPDNPPDPLDGVVTVQWASESAGQLGSATILSAQLSGIVGDVGIAITFDLDPMAAQTDGVVTVTHEKVPGSADSDGCGLCQNGGSFTLTYETQGVEDSAFAPAMVGCGF